VTFAAIELQAALNSDPVLGWRCRRPLLSVTRHPLNSAKRVG